MAYIITGSALANFVSAFTKICATSQQQRPTHVAEKYQVTSMILSRGSMMVNSEEGPLRVDIPNEELTDREQYLAFTQMLTEHVCHLFGLLAYYNEIYQCLQGDGLVIRFEGDIIVINPLNNGIGELDQF